MSPSLLAILPILAGLTLLICVIGFKRMVYFLNIGYAFSIVAVVLVALVCLWKNTSLLIILQVAAITFWGLRLGIFVVKRELSSGYQKERDRVDREYNHINLPIKIVIWISVSALYLMMVSPVLFSLEEPTRLSTLGRIFQGLGIAVMVAGLVLEYLADRQKSVFKASHPNTFCNTGLYKWVRCPNYLGEITFWIGTWMMGIGFYKTPFEWIVSLIGLVCIVYIMFSSTRRLEKTQIKRYGTLPEYKKYSISVPILIPFLPVYTLQK
jgi:steroid 5-alpha reductase family enzyme